MTTQTHFKFITMLAPFSSTQLTEWMDEWSKHQVGPSVLDFLHPETKELWNFSSGLWQRGYTKGLRGSLRNTKDKMCKFCRCQQVLMGWLQRNKCFLFNDTPHTHIMSMYIAYIIRIAFSWICRDPSRSSSVTSTLCAHVCTCLKNNLMSFMLLFLCWLNKSED